MKSGYGISYQVVVGKAHARKWPTIPRYPTSIHNEELNFRHLRHAVILTLEPMRIPTQEELCITAILPFISRVSEREVTELKICEIRKRSNVRQLYIRNWTRTR